MRPGVLVVAVGALAACSAPPAHDMGENWLIGPKAAEVRVGGAAMAAGGGMILVGDADGGYTQWVAHVDELGQITSQVATAVPQSESPAPHFGPMSPSASTGATLFADGDGYIVAFDSSGYASRTARFKRAFFSPYRAAATADGGMLVTSDHGVLEIAPTGEVANAFDLAAPDPANTPAVFGLASAADGGLYVLGRKQVAITLVRLAPDRTILWQEEFTGVSTSGDASITETSDGGAVVLVGDTAQAWLARLEPTGAIRWQTFLQATSELAMYSIGAFETGEGDVVAIGNLGAGWAATFDPDGALIATKSLTGLVDDAMVIGGRVVAVGGTSIGYGFVDWLDTQTNACGASAAYTLGAQKVSFAPNPLDLAVAPSTATTGAPLSQGRARVALEMTALCE